MSAVLLVDDSEVSRNELANLLKTLGVDSIHAINGKEGCKLFQEHQEIQLVISDINMPIMDGLTMLEEIRRTEPERKLSAVIVTSDASIDHKQRGKRAGVVAWVLKPINPAAFVTGIRSILNSKNEVRS